jgi:hypothetical protein
MFHNYILILLYFICFVAVVVVDSFPDSENPKTIEPLIIRPSTPNCKINIINNAECNNWNEIISTSFTLDDCPKPPWSRVILDLSFSEEGTQFDRFGALWINEIEILRTTTAEPSKSGIQWKTESDLTIYGNYFESNGNNLTSYLAIPNNVDSTYTGVIGVNATLTFYSVDDKYFPAQYPPFIIPLTNATTSPDGPFVAMEVIGNQSLNYSFILPFDMNVIDIEIDLFASGHGCEEFFYTNVPDDMSGPLGICGGGIYRELQVYIDDVFAGSINPFPGIYIFRYNMYIYNYLTNYLSIVIYTGGINPFLWRPLSGIMSFNIPSHRLSLRPFLGLLYDGKDHNISITVFGNNDQGYWYLDAALLLSIDDSVNKFIGGYINKYIADDVYVNVTRNETKPTEITFTTIGSHSYYIEGVLLLSNGSSIYNNINGNLKTINTNTITGTTLMKTKNNINCKIKSNNYQVDILNSDKININTIISTYNYPLYVNSYYAQNSTTFDMSDFVRNTYKRSKTLGNSIKSILDVTYDHNINNYDDVDEFSSYFTIAWDNSINSNATYNRSLDQTEVYIESDNSYENFEIITNNNVNECKSNCYLRNIKSNNGYIIYDEMQGSCNLPIGMYICGYEVCGGYNIDSTQISSFHNNANDNYFNYPYSIINNSVLPSSNIKYSSFNIDNFLRKPFINK